MNAYFLKCVKLIGIVLQGKRLISELKESLDNCMPPGQLVREVVKELINHARDCEDELKCPIPCCAAVNQYEEWVAFQQPSFGRELSCSFFSVELSLIF